MTFFVCMITFQERDVKVHVLIPCVFSDVLGLW